jgi:hypothetical protein
LSYVGERRFYDVILVVFVVGLFFNFMFWCGVVAGCVVRDGSINDVDLYVIIIKLLDSIFSTLLLFICQWEIKMYLTGSMHNV